MSDLEFEVEQHRTNIGCNAMVISMHANEIKYQQREYEILVEKANCEIKKNHALEIKAKQIEMKCREIEDKNKKIEPQNMERENIQVMELKNELK